jgi:DNA-binding transcriptional regulator YhcF (GntR family)
MYLRLDYQSGEPIYRQIVEQIKYRIASGELKPMDRLPSIREVAKQLKINPRTVVKVYEELENGGLVVTRQGQGVFITSRDADPAKTRQKVIAGMARRMLAEASRIGASPEEVLVIIQEVTKQMRTIT